MKGDKEREARKRCVFFCAAHAFVPGGLTALCNLADVHPLLSRHEPQHREHHKAGKETGPTVDQGKDKGIPEMRQEGREREGGR